MPKLYLHLANVLSSGALKRPFDVMAEETNLRAITACSWLQELVIQGIAPGVLPLTPARVCAQGRGDVVLREDRP